MRVLCEDVNESFCKLDFSEVTDQYKLAELKVMFADQLSAYTEGYKFNPSYRAGLWDGKKNFYKMIGDSMVFPKGMWRYLDRKVKKNLSDINFEYISDTVFETVSKEEFDKFLVSLNLPFQPYDYQYDAAYEAINSGRMTIGAATSAGKSFIIYMIFRWMLSKDIKTMLVVPNVMLTTQMMQDFKDYGFTDADDWIEKIGGENCKTIEEKRELFANNLEGGKNIISTWQSLYNSPDLFEEIGCIIVDECLRPDTLITTKDGEKMIKDVTKGDIVLTINEETSENEWKPVVKQHKNISSEQMYKITLENDKEVFITGNHKVNTQRGWIRVDELTLDDDILSLS